MELDPRDRDVFPALAALVERARDAARDMARDLLCDGRNARYAEDVTPVTRSRDDGDAR